MGIMIFGRYRGKHAYKLPVDSCSYTGRGRPYPHRHTMMLGLRDNWIVCRTNTGGRHRA